MFTRRLPMMHRDGWSGNKASSQMNTAWFMWERNDDGSYGDGFPRLIRVYYEAFRDAVPLAPGAGGNVMPAMPSAAARDEFARETPRKTVEERVDEERARALVWIAGQECFEASGLRRGIGRRDSTVAALIDDFLQQGLIRPTDDGFRISDAGMAVVPEAATIPAGKAVAI